MSQLHQNIHDNARAIEKIVDCQIRANELFQLPLNSVLLHLLYSIEAEARNILQFGAQRHNFLIHDMLDTLDVGVNQAYKICRPYSDEDKPEFNRSTFENAQKLLKEASSYRPICDAYIMWSRGKYNVDIDEKKNTVIFSWKETSNYELEATDQVVEEIQKIDNKESCLSKCLNNANKPDFEKLMNSIAVIGNSFTYKIDEQLWNAFSTIIAITCDKKFELPEDWCLNGVYLRDYRRFWETLCTRALIHQVACRSYDIQYSILIGNKQYFINELSHYCDLPSTTIEKIIECLIYNPHITNVDIIWQPFLTIGEDLLAISPTVVDASAAERNFISLINKIDQASYSRVLNQKEQIMADELTCMCKSHSSELIVVTQKKIDPTLPDVDIAIYDRATASLIVAEMKWLISGDSVQEVLSRETDLQKGVDQVLKLKQKYLSSPDSFLIKVFANDKYDVKNILFCVITRHNAGSSGIITDGVKIIRQNLFTKLLERASGNIATVIEQINRGSYLPQVGTDFEYRAQSVFYAGYTFLIPAVTGIDTTSENHNVNGQNIKKVGRNAPCPCGKINKATGQIMKYKKCCGK